MSGDLTFTYTPPLDGGLPPAEENVIRNLGNGVTDGESHRISINILSDTAIIIVDQLSCGLQCIGNIFLSMDTTLSEPLTFGGGVNTSSLLQVVESTSSFVGCMEAIVVNSNTLLYGDIIDKNGVTPGCNRSDCTNEFCFNGGTCRDHLFTTSCYCSFGYSGPRCEVLSLAHFPGQSFAVFPNLQPMTLSLEWSTAAEQGTIATLVEVRETLTNTHAHTHAHSDRV